MRTCVSRAPKSAGRHLVEARALALLRVEPQIFQASIPTLMAVMPPASAIFTFQSVMSESTVTDARHP